MSNQIKRDADRLREMAKAADILRATPGTRPAASTATILRDIADRLEGAVESAGAPQTATDLLLDGHEQRIRNLENNPKAPVPLHQTCKRDARPSTYNSFTEGAITLSYASRHLMQDLHAAVRNALASGDSGYGDNALARARAKLARRLGDLEARCDSFRAETQKVSRELELEEGNKVRESARATAAEQSVARAAEVAASQHRVIANQSASIEELSVKLADAQRANSALRATQGFQPGVHELAVSGRYYGSLRVVGTTWDGEKLRITVG